MEWRSCKARRLALGWSQSKLAMRARVSQPLVSVYERGRYMPKDEAVHRIAMALDAGEREAAQGGLDGSLGRQLPT